MPKLENLAPKVLIVGGGLAGISLGILLRRNGVKVLVVERSKAAQAILKGEYLQPQTVNFLNSRLSVDVFSKTNAGIIRELRFRDLSDNKRPYEVKTDFLIRYPKGESARSLPYEKLHEELRLLAREELGEDFIEGGVVTPKEVTSLGTIPKEHLNDPHLQLKFDGKTYALSPQWVIGCDGKGSQVRKWIKGIPKKVSKSVTIGSAAEYIVGCEINVKADISDRYEVIRTPGEGTFSFFGLGNGKQRLYWNTEKNNEGGKLWKNSILNSLGNIQHISNIDLETVGNPLGAEANSAWFGNSYKGRYILVGDANSTTTPFGGQGMNAVVKHVDFLVDILTETLSEKQMDKALESYQSMVLKYYAHLSVINFGLYHIFFNRNELLKPVTAHVLNKWEKKPALKDRAARLFGGIDQDTPNPLELYELWGGITSLKAAPFYADIRSVIFR